jgi:site-specific recombinase XerD
MTSLAPIIQGFFSAKLTTQKHASPHTISAYRDTLRLLLTYAQQVTATPPWQMELHQLDADLITGFLHHLEADRANSARTRNARLAAIHSMFAYAALRAPEDSATIQQVLAIEGSRTQRRIICWLTDDEAGALLTAPDLGTWIGRRDRTLILLALTTGLRVSELTRLTRRDVTLGPRPYIHCLGKGRRDRCTPLGKPTATVLRDWLAEQKAATDDDPLFSTRQGRPLTRDAIQARLTRYREVAALSCSSLAGKKLSPHVLRHSTAMSLRRRGIDTAVIALWLGHENITSTQAYLHADLELKERVLAKITPQDVPPGRYQPADPLLAYLESL